MLISADYLYLDWHLLKTRNNKKTPTDLQFSGNAGYMPVSLGLIGGKSVWRCDLTQVHVYAFENNVFFWSSGSLEFICFNLVLCTYVQCGFF